MTTQFDDLVLMTESDVEQKFIFPLLTRSSAEGLGYDPSDFRTKQDIRKIAIDKGGKKKLYFPDYAVVLDGVPALIIEAKAPEADLDEASREARLYATEINSNYPVGLNPCSRLLVTDGRRIIGYHWDSDKPVLSIDRADLNIVSPDFAELQSFAGKHVVQVDVERLLRKLRTAADYVRPVQLLGGKAVANESVGENSFGANVSIEYKYLFNPETGEERALVVENAYVTSKRKLAHVAPIDKIVRAAIPAHVLDATPLNDTGQPSEILTKLANSGRVRNELCLLIGSVGSGKSTFTDYLRVRALPHSVIGQTGWISINLNTAPLSKELIYGWAIEQIGEAIRVAHANIDFDELSFLRKIYHQELTRVEKGKASLFDKSSERYSEIVFEEIDRLQQDRLATLKATINYLYRDHGKLLVVVLDNCDKRSRDDQLLMFEVATWLKTSFHCMVFLPLRDTTYDQYRSEPPLDTVIKDLVFRIDPPLLERVIQARLEFALREVAGSSRKFVYRLPNGMNVECARSEVGDYLRSIVTTLFQDHYFRRIVTGLAGRNIRRGLEMLLDFCKSGHISEAEILKIRRSSGGYQVPQHVVSKILLKGKRRYYSDKETSVRNVFSSDPADPLPNPFVRLAILQWLKMKKRDFGPNKTLGFHKVSSLVADLQSAGYSKHRVMIELEELRSAECVVAEGPAAMVEMEDLVSLAPAGYVHLDLTHNINYLATVAEDVWFRENQLAKQIADVIVGKARFRADSRAATISISKILVDYLVSYQKKFVLPSAGVVPDSSVSHLVDLGEMVAAVERAAGNDQMYREAQVQEAEYPVGTQVDGQVISVQAYGVFVEFGASGKGLVHSSRFNGLNNDINQLLDVGDWVIVEILGFNAEHGRFSLSLIDR